MSPGSSPGVPASATRSVAACVPAPGADPDPILCAHCGRTARNGLSCQGMCVADSGY
ncbi:MAG: hypothetical protein ACK6BG_06065 [Cyanobacteriota bacterium]